MWARVKCSCEHLPYKRYWNKGELKNTLSKKSHTARPRPPSHHHDLYGSAVVAERAQAHAASSEDFKLRSNFGNRESRWCLQHRLSHPPTGSIYRPLFLPPHFSPCRNSPSLMPAAWPRWLLPGRLFLFFKSRFLSHTSLVDLPLDFRMLPAWHRLLRAHMLLRNLVRHIVLLHIHPADSLHFRICYRPCCDTSW